MTLEYERKNVWESLDPSEHDKIMEFSQGYMDFLDKGQTERRAVSTMIEEAKAKGFVDFESVDELKRGDKIYYNFMDKSLVLMVMGENIDEGMNIIGAHTDSPRLDLKANPLYEGADKSGLALMKTHYYGGVKKYQWVNIPLALVGAAFTKDGKKVEIEIGLEESDPIFYINDLLIHLSKDQMKKTMEEGITAEQLNVVVGHKPSKESESDSKIKALVLELIKEKYGLVEEDFLVSELTFIPAIKARDVGFDRAMIAAYGHDDKVCAYTSFEAIMETEDPERTAVALIVDKEEIGSVGATGMESYFFENMIADIMHKTGPDAFYRARKAIQNSKALSADVNTALDPSFADVVESLNACRVGYGVGLAKYTGARGKGGSNDANAEYLAQVRHIFDDGGVIWQTGELGKTDQGGGGTIAFILAKYGAEVVDCGPGMLSMHAPYELISKADVYMSYKAYKAFYKA